MKYPQGVSTLSDKIEFAYASQEKLRIEHNAKGDDFRSGRITKDEFESYRNGRFREKRDVITAEILPLKESMKNSVRFNPDLDEL